MEKRESDSDGHLLRLFSSAPAFQQPSRSHLPPPQQIEPLTPVPAVDTSRPRLDSLQALPDEVHISGERDVSRKLVGYWLGGVRA